MTGSSSGQHMVLVRPYVEGHSLFAAIHAKRIAMQAKTALRVTNNAKNVVYIHNAQNLATNPVLHAQKDVIGHVLTLGSAICHAEYPATYYLAQFDAPKSYLVVTSVLRYVASNVRK
ncbi:hypothetical protein MMC25_001869 [Agyrium rufum]|nr:hypothetical protein [Agyrium rufum]